MGWAEKKWFGGWDDMHKMRFNQPEEDDGFFVYTFVTEAIFLLFLHVDELWEAGFQDALPPEKRRKVMEFYRSCLQRRLYASGPNKTILTKATQSSGAVESLLEAFPDGKFITIVRHPYESVPSHVSVFWPVWQAHSPELKKDGPVSKAYARLAVQWFKHLFEFRRKVNPKQYYCIDYRDLTRNPLATLEKLYEHFGWTMSDALSRETGRRHPATARLQAANTNTPWRNSACPRIGFKRSSVRCWSTMPCRGNSDFHATTTMNSNPKTNSPEKGSISAPCSSSTKGAITNCTPRTSTRPTSGR